jgi:ribose 5-phosphate isomerase B
MLDKSETVALGCDHAGFHLKEYLKIKLAESGYSIRDYGTFSEESVDYPDIAHPIASEVDKGHFMMALLICGSGNGVCITANKYGKVRAALCWNEELAKLARAHNDANVLCLPARFIDREEALKTALTFLSSDFEGGRHKTRVDKITSSQKA